MPQNTIQFQKGMSLIQFLDEYGTENDCEKALEVARWGRQFSCPKCGCAEHSVFYRQDKKYWQCTENKHQSTVRSGTLFHASKLPLTVWFLALYLIAQSKTNLSALSLKRHLGVSYPTAWLIKHKLMQTMREREDNRQLTGRVVADDAYLGGVTSGGKRGRGAKKKGLFIAAVEVNEDDSVRYLRLDLLADLSGDTIKDWAGKAFTSTCHLVTDGYSSLTVSSSIIGQHEPVIVSPYKSSDFKCFRWINTVISNTKTSMRGAYHGFKVSKYAASYLAEFQYRFNRRFDLEALVPRLMYACVQNQPRTLAWIRTAEFRCLCGLPVVNNKIFSIKEINAYLCTSSH